MAKEKEKPLENTPTSPLRPSCVIVTEYNGNTRCIEAEKYDDLLWIYTQLQAKGGYKDIKFVHCTGNPLKLQLVVSYRYVGEGIKEPILFENPLLAAIHDDLFIEK